MIPNSNFYDIYGNFIAFNANFSTPQKNPSQINRNDNLFESPYDNSENSGEKENFYRENEIRQNNSRRVSGGTRIPLGEVKAKKETIIEKKIVNILVLPKEKLEKFIGIQVSGGKNGIL